MAAKIRKISPKFEDLIRPEVMETQKWLEYEQEVERIASRRENIYAVMPPREKKQVVVPPRQEPRTQLTDNVYAVMPPTEEKEVVVFPRQESVSSPNRSVNRLTNIAPCQNNSRRVESEEEELASDTNQHWEGKSPTHNSRRI